MLFTSIMPTHAEKNRERRVLFPLKRANIAAFCLYDRAAGRSHQPSARHRTGLVYCLLAACLPLLFVVMEVQLSAIAVTMAMAMGHNAGCRATRSSYQLVRSKGDGGHIASKTPRLRWTNIPRSWLCSYVEGESFLIKLTRFAC
jgi:hypothetical protein